MSQKILIAIIIAAILLGGGLYWLGQKQPQKYTGPVEKITLATIPEEISTLIWIAQNQGYFTENGLEVTIEKYPTGIETTKALLAGEVDLATTVDFVITSQGLKKFDFKILGSIATADVTEVVAWRDRVGQLADLQGKTIGIKLNSSSEFWLARTLVDEGLPYDAVTLVDVSPPKMADVISSGEVDAVITWQPHATKAKESLGENALSWSAQGDQDLYWLVFGTQEWVQAHPLAVTRLLSALVQAEEFVNKYEQRTKDIIVIESGLEGSYLDKLWPSYNFFVTLPQALLITLEEQARWSIANKRTDKTEVPNYLDFIYLDGLEAVKSEAVTIIR